MMPKVITLVVRGLRLCSDSGRIGQKGFELEHRVATSFRHLSESSTSSWGTGEPPVDETPTKRGVMSGQSPSSAASAVGRQADEPTSTSPFDTDKTAGEQKHQPKKSRTGGNLTDDGQVHTPNLQRMRSTREIMHNAGRVAEERLASEKKGPA